MAEVVFSIEDIEKLFHERFSHPHPMIQKRLEALYLKSQGVSHKKICSLLRISRASIANWLKVYKEDGIEGVKKLKYRKKWGELSTHQQTLEELFRTNPPRTVQEAIRAIKKSTGLERHRTSVYRFLKGLGLSYRKSGLTPGKTNPETQEEFKKKLSNQGWKMPGKGREKSTL